MSYEVKAQCPLFPLKDVPNGTGLTLGQVLCSHSVLEKDKEKYAQKSGPAVGIQTSILKYACSSEDGSPGGSEVLSSN